LLQLDISLGRRLVALGVVLTSGALGAMALAATANAASPPPPTSSATCYGGVTPAPTADDPNLLDYKFNCDQRITAYTVIVNRGVDNSPTIDDFEPAPSAYLQDGTTPDTTVAWTCEGYLPSLASNCNTGKLGAYMGAWSWAVGSVDLIDPYCKNLPAGAKPGTPAEPQASVALVVTDVSGGQDGPFRLYYSQKCAAVPDRVPAPVKPKAKPRHASKKHSTTNAKGTK
jgi:hypothetical protein